MSAWITCVLVSVFFLCDVRCLLRSSHGSRSIALHIVLLMTYDYDFLVLRTNFEGDKSELVLRRVAASMLSSHITSRTL